jgi:anti-sigma B factor antagonist
MPDHSHSQAVLPDCIIGETWSGRTVVLSVFGTLDMLTAPNLDIAVNNALREGPAALIIDLTDVDFLASHGMGVLIAAHHRAGSDIAFLVVADGPTTARPLTLTGIYEIIDIHPTLSQALDGLVA